MLAQRADPNLKVMNEAGWSYKSYYPLMLSCIPGHEEAVKTLLDAKADPNIYAKRQVLRVALLNRLRSFIDLTWLCLCDRHH